MAENEKKVNDQHSDAEERGNKQDYNKMVGQQPAGTTAGDTIASSRDLGSIGGGSVPEPRNPSMGSGKSPGGMNTASGSTTGKGRPGAEQTTDRGSETMNDMAGGRANTIDRHGQGNIGGRHPSEPETPLGDRDTRSGREVRGESDISDPMTSRHPSKVNQDTSAHSNQDQKPQK